MKHGGETTTIESADLIARARRASSLPPFPPHRALPVRGSRLQRRLATTWNAHGRLLAALGETHGVEPACAIAVLCVESAGRGFAADGRLIVRFEVHHFWRRWGHAHAGTFARHFRFDDARPWTEHRGRARPGDPWEAFHGQQDGEWRALAIARALDDGAALESTSMGAPQIMGFHHRVIGYATVQDMFRRFGEDVRHQIRGLFDLLDDSMRRALRRRDFEAFARAYNGPGQAALYAARLRAHHDAFAGQLSPV